MIEKKFNQSEFQKISFIDRNNCTGMLRNYILCQVIIISSNLYLNILFMNIKDFQLYNYHGRRFYS